MKASACLRVWRGFARGGWATHPPMRFGCLPTRLQPSAMAQLPTLPPNGPGVLRRCLPCATTRRLAMTNGHGCARRQCVGWSILHPDGRHRPAPLQTRWCSSRQTVQRCRRRLRGFQLQSCPTLPRPPNPRQSRLGRTGVPIPTQLIVGRFRSMSGPGPSGVPTARKLRRPGWSDIWAKRIGCRLLNSADHTLCSGAAPTGCTPGT